MAVALNSCEAPTVVATTVQEPKGEAGVCSTESMAEDFQKKLQDCIAMIVPMQQPTMIPSVANADDGMQADPGTQMTASGVACVLEGIEMPQLPTGVTATPTETAALPIVMPQDGATQGMNATEERQPDTTGPIAWMQNTTAGDTPVKTQDEILKTIGAYLEPQDSQTQPAEGQTKVQPPAQPNASNPPEVRENIPTAVPETAQKPTMVQTTTQAAAQADKSDVSPGTLPDKRMAPQAELPEQAAKPQSASAANVPAAADTPRTAPVVHETVVADTPETRAGDAQYTRENVLRIVDKVSTHAAEGRYDFDVELKPEFLGKVSIKLTMQDGTIRMQIKTDDMSVRSMLADQTAALQSALKDKGVALTNVDVTYHSQASLDGGGQPFEQHNGGGRQGSAYYAQSDTAAFETSAEPYSYYVGNSSVEFLA
jgi:flagellar hook-length control protein FliK